MPRGGARDSTQNQTLTVAAAPAGWLHLRRSAAIASRASGHSYISIRARPLVGVRASRYVRVIGARMARHAIGGHFGDAIPKSYRANPLEFA